MAHGDALEGKFGKSLCTYKRCWKWYPRASIQAWTRLILFANIVQLDSTVAQVHSDFPNTLYQDYVHLCAHLESNVLNIHKRETYFKRKLKQKTNNARFTLNIFRPLFFSKLFYLLRFLILCRVSSHLFTYFILYPLFPHIYMYSTSVEFSGWEKCCGGGHFDQWGANKEVKLTRDALLLHVQVHHI